MINEIATTTEIKTWERQPSEGGKPFGAFVVYRDLGTQRTLSGVAEKLGKTPGYKKVLERWSVRFGWVERCAAYDGYMDSIRVAEREKEVREATERWRIAANALLVRGLQRLKTLQDEEIPAATALAFIDRAIYILRSLQGNQPPAVLIDNSKTLALRLDVSRLPPEILELIANAGDAPGLDDLGEDYAGTK